MSHLFCFVFLLLFFLCPVMLPLPFPSLLSIYSKYWFALIQATAVIHMYAQNLLVGSVCQLQMIPSENINK